MYSHVSVSQYHRGASLICGWPCFLHSSFLTDRYGNALGGQRAFQTCWFPDPGVQREGQSLRGAAEEDH
jgi:hypothetical protein